MRSVAFPDIGWLRESESLSKFTYKGGTLYFGGPHE